MHKFNKCDLVIYNSQGMYSSVYHSYIYIYPHRDTWCRLSSHFMLPVITEGHHTSPEHSSRRHRQIITTPVIKLWASCSNRSNDNSSSNLHPAALQYMYIHSSTPVYMYIHICKPSYNSWAPASNVERFDCFVSISLVISIVIISLHSLIISRGIPRSEVLLDLR